MYSYEERLATFAHWPAEFRKSLVKRLALIGQYSSRSGGISTTCVYCKKRMDAWRTRDVPLVEHMKHNDNCVIFHLEWLSARRSLFDLQEQHISLGDNPFADIDWAKYSRHYKVDGQYIGRNKENEPRKDGQLVRFDIKEGVPFMFCISCGSAEVRHKCSLLGHSRKKLEVLTEQRLSKPCFYVKWLKGDYLEMIECYLNYEIYIPNDKKDVVRAVLSRAKGEHALAPAGPVINRIVDQLAREFDLELQEVERKSLETVNGQVDE